jgi:DNA-binding NarL/FixJ family response regulator
LLKILPHLDGQRAAPADEHFWLYFSALTCFLAAFGEAGNATEALAQVWKKPWETVLLDISMHGRTGLDILKEIRASASRVPVLVLSAHPEEQYHLCWRALSRESSSN